MFYDFIVFSLMIKFTRLKIMKQIFSLDLSEKKHLDDFSDYLKLVIIIYFKHGLNKIAIHFTAVFIDDKVYPFENNETYFKLGFI